MIEKHGTNYDAMARDHHNDYQLTARQLERKMEKFKKIPKIYERYLTEKAAGKNFLVDFQMDDYDPKYPYFYIEAPVARYMNANAEFENIEKSQNMRIKKLLAF